MNTEDLVARLKGFAQTRDEIIALYLYGSYANGTARARSDVDVAVLFSPAVADALDAELKLGNALAALPGLAQVEVIALDRATPKLRAEVFQTGRRVCARSTDSRGRFI
jgi:predicted nucleotidyltransferase